MYSIDAILKELKSQSKIFGSILIDDTGAPIAADLPTHIDEDKIAIIYAIVLQTGEKGIRDNDYGNLDWISIKGDKGEMFLFKVKEGLILCVLAPVNTPLGILMLSAQNAIKKIRRVME